MRRVNARMGDTCRMLDIKHDVQRQPVPQTVLTLIIAINTMAIALTRYAASRYGPPPLGIPITIAVAEMVIFYIVYRHGLAASHATGGPAYVFERTISRRPRRS